MIIVSVRYQCPLLIDNRTDWTALNILAQWHHVPKTLPEASHDSRRSVSPLPMPVYQQLLHDSRARHATWYTTRQIPPDSLANLSKRKLIILRLSAHTEAPSLENYLQLENNWSQRAYLRLTIRCDSLLSRLHWPQPMCHRAKKATHCASAYKQAGSTKNMWTAMLYSKHMWVWMVLVPLSDLKLSGCQDKEAPRFFASLFFILLIRSSIFSPFPFFNGPFGKDVPRYEEQKTSIGNRTVLFERHYSSNYSHLERNLFLYLQQCPIWSTIEQLRQLHLQRHCALGVILKALVSDTLAQRPEGVSDTAHKCKWVMEALEWLSL